MKKSFFFLALLLLTSFVLAQTTYTYKAEKLKFTVPDGWTTEMQDGILVVSDPTGSCEVEFFVFDQDELDDQIDEEFEAMLDEDYDNIQIEFADQIEQHNGMDCLTFEGTLASADEGDLDVSGGLLETPTGDVVAITMFCDPTSAEEFADELDELLSSIKPAK